MRIRVLSDLHQEFGELDVPEVDCDCVVLAGDTSTRHNGLRWALRRFTTTPVIYVCGNHEYYGESLPSLTTHLREEAQGTNVHVLENESVTIGGVHFFGCTLWADLALFGDWRFGAAFAGMQLNDYKRIRYSPEGYRRLQPDDTRRLHRASLEALQEFCKSHQPRRSVIVTHHAPSAQSLPPERQGDMTTCAYASRLDDFILKHQPCYWIHGHIHRTSDYQIGRTRVLANPRGYPDESNPAFKPDLIIEVH